MSGTLLDELRQMGFVKTLSFTDRESGERTSRDVVRYDGLLYAAKKTGLAAIATRLVQAPAEPNGWTAIVHARAETKAGTFTGIGDANPNNVTPKIRPHFVRMAETRAKARALRDAVDLHDVLCLDELEEIDGEPPAREERARRSGNGAGNGSNGHRTANGRNGHDHSPANHRNGRRRTATAPNQGHQRQSDSPADRSGPEPAHGNGRGAGADSNSGDDMRPMSDRQRRFLFRLLAEDGVEGQAATDALCDALGTRDLRRATSAQASALIDKFTGNGQRAKTYG